MAGPAIVTPAMVVGAIRYGESSRIVRLSTRDAGLVSAIARGVDRPRSRFAGLQVLAEGLATFVPGRGELDTLTDFELSDSHHALARSLPAFRAAHALAELAARTLEREMAPELHDRFRAGIRLVEAAPPAAAEVAGLAAIWRLIAALGYGPALDHCVQDGRIVAPGKSAVISVELGGLLCDDCSRGSPVRRLEAEDVAALRFFLTGAGVAPDLDRRHEDAHRRLVCRWIRRQVCDAQMPALEQWQRGVADG